MIHGKLEDEIVEPVSGDAGLDMGHQKVQRGSGQLASLAHARKSISPVQRDLALALLLGAIVVEVGHAVGPFRDALNVAAPYAGLRIGINGRARRDVQSIRLTQPCGSGATPRWISTSLCLMRIVVWPGPPALK